MRTHASEATGLGGAAREVAEHASALVRLELKLAAAELKKKLSGFAVGLGLAAGGLVLLLFAVGFALAGGAVALGAILPMWAALLSIAGALLVAALAAVLIGLGAVRRSTPVPEQAIREAKLTTEAIRSDGHA